MTILDFFLVMTLLFMLGFTAYALKDGFNESIIQQDTPLNKVQFLEEVNDEDDCEQLMKQCEDVYKFCRGQG